MPTLVLLFLSEIRVFVPWQPESKPVYIPLLGGIALLRLLQYMLCIGNVYEVNRFHKPT